MMHSLTMKGGRKRQPERTSKEKISNGVSSQGAEEPSLLPDSDFNTDSISAMRSFQSTPKRRRGQSQETYQTSTPLRRSSRNHQSSISPTQVELTYTRLRPRVKTSSVASPRCTSSCQRSCRRVQAARPRPVGERVAKEQMQTGTKNRSPAEGQRDWKPRRKGSRQRDATTQPTEHSRPRFELKQDESPPSADPSMELSHRGEEPPSLSPQEDEESAEEEELPSFLMQVDKKPPAITQGAFVWCKYRNYPFWPALVKSVNHKTKKASIVFIDHSTIDKQKGFTVALKTLKPFDCEGADECKAKEEHNVAIEWCLKLIRDYRIRIACGSFSGSFIEYLAHDMSYPVRRKYPLGASERRAISSDSMMEEHCGDPKGEDSFSKQQEEVSSQQKSKRLLPDRTQAAHNRTNEQLVHYIVKQRMVERRLLAVIRGQVQSRWLRSFHTAKPNQVVNIYLEDDQQLDQVYWYLNQLYATAVPSTPCRAEVKPMESVPFVLDVLLPEAIIYAIAGVDKVSVKKAEEKYLRGRCLSNREREEFDQMIEQEMKRKSQPSEYRAFPTFHPLED